MGKSTLFLSALLLLFVTFGCSQRPATAVPNQSNDASQSTAAKPQLIEFYADW